MATNPMEQFQVHKIGPEIEISGINLSFTKSLKGIHTDCPKLKS